MAAGSSIRIIVLLIVYFNGLPVASVSFRILNPYHYLFLLLQLLSNCCRSNLCVHCVAVLVIGIVHSAMLVLIQLKPQISKCIRVSY